MRVRAFPFNDDVEELHRGSTRHGVCYRAESAMHSCAPCLMAEFEFGPDKLKSVLCFDGTPISARNIRKQIQAAPQWQDRTSATHCSRTYRRQRRGRIDHELPDSEIPPSLICRSMTLVTPRPITRAPSSTLCAGCGHDSIIRLNRYGLPRTVYRAPQDCQAVGHRLFFQVTHILPG